MRGPETARKECAMKSRFAFVVVFALVSIVAAPVLGGAMSFGAKAGLSVSNITGVPEEWEDDTAYRTAFLGGVFLNYAINGSVSVQPEILYASKGAKGSVLDDPIDVDVEASFDYIEIPALLKYSFLRGRRFRPCVYAGPSFAYCLSSELEASALFLSASADIGSLTHTTDVGIVAGGGFDYQVGGGTITMDARFTRGFTNVVMTGDFKINGSWETINVDDFKNYGFVFMLGYLF